MWIFPGLVDILTPQARIIGDEAWAVFGHTVAVDGGVLVVRLDGFYFFINLMKTGGLTVRGGDYRIAGGVGVGV